MTRSTAPFESAPRRLARLARVAQWKWLMKIEQSTESRAGRPTKYSDETIGRICEALAGGMPIKASCIAAGIGVTTLNEWRDKYPEIEERMSRARERFREKAPQTIKKAIDNDDWRAAVAALKLVFPEYRESAKGRCNGHGSGFYVRVDRRNALEADRAERESAILIGEQRPRGTKKNAFSP